MLPLIFNSEIHDRRMACSLMNSQRLLFINTCICHHKMLINAKFIQHYSIVSSKSKHDCLHCTIVQLPDPCQLFFPRIISHTFFSVLLIHGGLGFGSWIGFSWLGFPVDGVLCLWCEAFLVFWEGALYVNTEKKPGKNFASNIVSHRPQLVMLGKNTQTTLVCLSQTLHRASFVFWLKVC